MSKNFENLAKNSHEMMIKKLITYSTEDKNQF